MAKQEKETFYDTIKNLLNKNSKLMMAVTLLLSSAVLILSKIRDNIDNFNVSDLEILTHDTSFIFGAIILLSIIIYAIVDLFFDKSDHEKISKDLKNGLNLVNEMLEMKGIDRILTNKMIAYQETESEKITLILENLYMDIPNKYAQYFGTEKEIGSFSDEVHKNIKDGKQYLYYLKYDNTTHKAIELHMKSHYKNIIKSGNHKNIKEPMFILIPANEFNFFSDIYLYEKKDDDNPQAFEHLPTLQKETQQENGTKDVTLYYLRFDENQVKKLSNILLKYQKKYGITLASNLEKHEEYILSQSKINIIEENAQLIQIVTDTLADDLLNGVFFDAVHKNLKIQKKYTYFLPDTVNIRNEIEQYHKDHGIEYSSNCTFIRVPLDSFIFYSTIFIYNEKTAFEFIASTNQYYKYDISKLQKISTILAELTRNYMEKK